jgi:hypothetical protein
MSNLDKLKQIITFGSAVAKPFVPGTVGSILDAVNKGIADKSDPQNEAVLKTLGEVNDQQTEAILRMHERLKALEAKR